MGNKITVKKMAMVGVLAALVFAASWISIPIPTVLGVSSRLHLGNVMCQLSGILLGPVFGGLAAGIGSMFYDFTNPVYFSSAPFTLVFKFLMAFICGKIAWGHGARGTHFGRNAAGAACGAVSYVILYVGKNLVYNLFFLRAEVQTALIDMAQRGTTSLINGLIAVAVAVPLASAVRKGLQHSGQSLIN